MAQIQYRRGEINAVYDKARYFLKNNSGLYVMLGAAMLLSKCAIWRGDIRLWNEVKKYVFKIPHETEKRRAIISCALANIDMSIYDNDDFPEWFKSGDFEILPIDSHPAARVEYVRYLYLTGFRLASKQIEIKDMTGLSYMSMIPQIAEPLITQAIVDKTIVPEISLRLLCAIAYYNTGQKDKAIKHIDIALTKALADKLYGLLAENITDFDGLLEERIKLIDENSLDAIKELQKSYNAGKAKLVSVIKNRYITSTLTTREREVAKLTAFGFTVKEISEALYISQSTVKQTITKVIQKTHIHSRKEIAYIL